MHFLSIVFPVSLVGCIAAFALPGWSDLILLSGPCAMASLVLLVARAFRRPAAAPNPVIVDGSNVMHWKGGEPRYETLRAVLGHLASLGFTPNVVFDANAGYLLCGRYRDDRFLGKALGLPVERVLVVDRGTPADPVILSAARRLEAPIVTNDRFRDWTADYP